MRFPSISAVADALKYAKLAIDVADTIRGNESEGLDVRLQVQGDGSWALHTCDPGWDLDHNGFWGSSTLARRDNCRELARDLIDQCRDEHAMCAC